VISLADAVEKSLTDQDLPLVSEYDLFRMAFDLVKSGVYADQPIKRLPATWDGPRHRNLLRRLNGSRVLAQDRDFNSGVWRVVQSTRSASAAEAMCIADPFCYVSHLSAMQRYGLTDRVPEALHVSRPKGKLWTERRDAKVADELPASKYPDGRILLRQVGVAATLRKRGLIIHETKYPGAATDVRGEKTRIATIGVTFVDMLEAPELCGGMQHALDAWDSHARTWIDEIVEAVDQSPSGIAKVRAGYILSERLKIHGERIEAWKAFAQRGGSRKLDPGAAYKPVFSEAWMISLNV
jgi:predicted transcriptional regulator of viral defense system